MFGRARKFPDDPWLFHADGWDWRWRSWSQVADQAARGAAELASWIDGETRHEEFAFALQANADSIAAGLAILAAGLDARATSSEQLADQPRLRHGADDESRWPALPPCHSVLERWQPVAFPSMGEPCQVSTTGANAPGRNASGSNTSGLTKLPETAYFAAAGRLAEALPDLPKRPVLVTSASLPGSAVFTAMAWSLTVNSAWILELDGSRFFGCIRWARPHIVLMTFDELPLLAELPKRHRRLQAVVVAGCDAAQLADWHGKTDEQGNLAVPMLALQDFAD